MLIEIASSEAIARDRVRRVYEIEYSVDRNQAQDALHRTPKPVTPNSSRYTDGRGDGASTCDRLPRLS